ncbi:rhamnogalacturonan acetylesterase [Sphingopyxis sp. MWB1]|uniref:rhamnogalacturonan acetylesterase n=1 Tax=Sphingopyxis sp. MWB1 TaxID=1537715 RepID=UPI000B00A156|nr:rhamnogalacturonan acetylesterase [Sphingopyxis sp. MWB1]
MIHAMSVPVVSALSLLATPAPDRGETVRTFHPDAARLYDGSSGFEPDDRDSFSIAVAEGNWRVSVTLGSAGHAAVTTVKTEARRLMVDRLATRPGEFVQRDFIVNVRTPLLPPPPAHAPGGARVALNQGERDSRTWDDRLTLEFSDAANVRQISIERANVPTIYLAGDSTVTDQPFEPAASWGQMLTAFAGPDIAIANHAESGETLKSFLAARRLAKILSTIRPGDYLFIQFGHNDQKEQWPQSYADPRWSYPAYLRAYIAEARARGATPILVTSPERRNFAADGTIAESLSDYAEAMRLVAHTDDVPLIDLNAYTRQLYAELGEERAAHLFNDAGRDRTHHNNAGAWILARYVADRSRAIPPGLAAAFPSTAPASPASLYRQALGIAASSAHSSRRPAGN